MTIRFDMAVREYGIRPGGFGLPMTRSLVDELIYNEARNEVIFNTSTERGRIPTACS